MDEQRLGRDGAIERDGFGADSKTVVMTPEQRVAMESWVLEHTANGHRFALRGGGEGIAYHDARGRAVTKTMQEFGDGELVLLAGRMGWLGSFDGLGVSEGLDEAMSATTVATALVGKAAEDPAIKAIYKDAIKSGLRSLKNDVVDKFMKAVRAAGKSLDLSMSEIESGVASLSKVLRAEATDRVGFDRLLEAKGDPYWTTAKRDGVAKDGTKVKRGDKILYWPNGKIIMTGKQAEDAWRRFESERGDEEGTPY